MVRRSLENHDHSSTGNGGKTINPETVEVAESLGIPVESSDADADNGRLYFNSTDNTIKYKDSGGNVYSGAQGDVSNPMTADLDADGNNIENVGSLSTDKETVNHGTQIGRYGEYIFASKFDGADADARLDAALTEASTGDSIFLENDRYTDNRAISKQVAFIGTQSGISGSDIDADWTLNNRTDLHRVCNPGGNGSLTFNNSFCGVYNSALDPGTVVTIAANNVRYVGNRGGDVRFQSGASGGIVDGCVGTAFTDNDGGNVQGDIA